ncbi:MAG: squalene/phytoene synthase family protein, partial [Gammaproteobacteria bacterium]|nr:squalene/phytoene synthase family protein [Gammaproteobacteria bacterium]
GGYSTFDVLKKRCIDVEARVLEITVRIVALPGSPAAGEFARDLGIGLALSRFICEFGRDARRNRVFIPRDELERYAVPLTDLLHAQPENMSACLDYQIARAIEYIDKAMALLPHDLKASQQPVLTLAAISRATLREIQRHQIEHTRETLLLTPLRMWWIAFRTYHRL